MPIFRIIVVLLLIVLIGLTLYNNKREIDQRTALAELKVEAWPVEVAKVRPTSFAEKFKYHGVLAPHRSLMVTSLAQGRVEQLFAVAGKKVSKGDVLARINDDLLQAELSAMEASLAQAQANLLRMENLSAGEAVTAQQLEQAQLRVKADQAKLQSLQKRIGHTLVKAPFRGVIKNVFVELGGVVGPGVPIGELIDQSVLKLSLSLTESQIREISPGMSVMIETDVYPGRLIEAEVSKVAVAADRSLKFPVEVTFNNTGDLSLRSGMFATAKFATEEDQGLWIKRESVLGGTDQPFVYVVEGNNSQKKEVVLGRSSSDLVEIIDGLSPDEEVVISGHRNLSDGATIKRIKQTL